jgi:predicted AAA+ superfamily ATPase
MLLRALTIPLHRAVQAGGSLLLQGPRAAGKTTLLRREFPGHTYVTLEDARDRSAVRADPAAFLARLRGRAILDDLHRAPELQNHLAGTQAPWPLLLASSRRLSLPLPTLELHPPTLAERQRRPPLTLAMLGRFLPTAPAGPAAPWPHRNLFLERDIPALVHVRDVDRFESFLTAARARTGQPLDQQALAREAGVSHRTVVRWLAALDDCFLTLRLVPADLDLGRRLIRAPKLHFLDADAFESAVVSELYRNARHAGETPDLRYWRDSNGLTVPLVVQSEVADPVPVAIAAQPTPAETESVRRWMKLAGVQHGAVIAEAARSHRRLKWYARSGL